MHNRGGFPVKNVVYAVFVLFLLYMVYLYHGSRTSLREVEMTASRFRQESEERAAEIQGLLQSKDKQTEACQNEKHELNNRIKSINQQHSMLESQYKEMEADFMKQKQDMDNLKMEQSAAESQHAQEFQSLKQQKELEISELKDQVANAQRQNDELSSNVQSLNQKLAYAQSSQQQLLDQNTQLQSQVNNQQQELQLQQQQLQQQQQQQQDVKQQQPLVNQQAGLFQAKASALNQQGDSQLSNIVRNMKITGLNKQQPGLAGQGNILGSDTFVNKADLGNSDLAKGDTKEHLDQLNAQHQVMPPNNDVNNNNIVGDSKDKDKGVLGEEDDLGKEQEIDNGLGDNVVPNDPNHRQILEPNLIDYADDNKDLRGDLDTGMKANQGPQDEQQQEEEEEEDEDGMDVGQKQPLNLDQIDVPNRGVNAGDQGNQAVVQQVPPLMDIKNDLKGDTAERRDVHPVAPA